MWGLLLREELVRQVDPQQEAEPEEDESHHAEDEGHLEVGEAAEVLPAVVDGDDLDGAVRAAATRLVVQFAEGQEAEMLFVWLSFLA